MSKPWTEEEIKTLVELWPTKTASEISKITGRNRNSIIGRVNRMGLKPKREGVIRKIYERLAEKRFGPLREPKPAPKRPGKPVVFRAQEVNRKPPRYVPPTQIWSGKGVPFLDTGYGQCRAILGSSGGADGLTMVCGKPVKQGSVFSFCEDHNRLYTRPWGR